MIPQSIEDVEAIERVPLEQQNTLWTVGQLIEHGAALDPGKAALHYLEHGSLDDELVTIGYARLLEGVRQAANLFESLGVGPRDPVAILLPNVPEHYMALLGAALAGVAFPLNWMAEPAQLGELIHAARAKVLVALGPQPGMDIWPKAEALRLRFGAALPIVQVAKAGEGTPEALDWHRLTAAQPGDRLRFQRDTRPSDPAFYIHTGGTTSQPRIASISHRNAAYKRWASSVSTGQRPERIVLGASPLFHVGGAVLKTLIPLSWGQTIVIPGSTGFRNRRLLQDYWRLIERFRITELSGVPTVLGALMSVPVGDADISSLSPTATTGSAPLPAEVARYFEDEIGIRIQQDYGLTEATATVAIQPAGASRKPGSSGLRLPFTQVRVIRVDSPDDAPRDCETGRIGEILVRGPGVVSGYVGASSAASPFLPGGEGWLKTGDLGRLDADGHLWVTGRKKDLIIRGGHNIDPGLIEEALRTHPDVAQVAAVGKPDAYAGELPVAYVQARPGAVLDADALIRYAREHIPERGAVPVEVFVVDALPLTSVGKISKQELRARSLCSTLSTLLSQHLPEGVQAQVSSRADRERGTMVEVSLAAGSRVDEKLVEQGAKELLGRFAFASSVTWREQTAPGHQSEPASDRERIRGFIAAGQKAPVRLNISPFAASMEPTLLHVDTETRRLELRCRAGEEYVAARGTLQGGAVATLLDASMAFLALAVLPPDRALATANLNVSYLRPATPGAFRVQAEIERLGRTTIFARARLCREDGEAVATATAVLPVFDLDPQKQPS